MTRAAEDRTGPAGRLAGHPTSRPGTKAEAWWSRGQRTLTVEMAYLLLDGPLDLTGDERGFLTALWRHDRRQEWPTDEQWALRFDVDERTVRRWRSQLIEAGMIKFDRPWNIPGAAGDWKGPRKDHGVYTLLPPTQWRYRNAWRYAGAHVGWVDGDGVVVEAAPSVTRESAPSRLGLPGASHEGQSAPASALASAPANLRVDATG